MANVFVSYRSTDSTFARQLAAEIESRGHTVWLDQWKINIGDSIIDEISLGLEEAEFLVMCYSGAGESSPWMGREWMSTLARQLDGAGVKIIPVRFPGGVPPALLADIKYLDLSENWGTGMDQLHARLSH